MSIGEFEIIKDSEDELKKMILRIYVKLSDSVPLVPTVGKCF
jgi:hypothetical protein